jgi:hypothetical protein
MKDNITEQEQQLENTRPESATIHQELAQQPETIDKPLDPEEAPRWRIFAWGHPETYDVDAL